MKHVVITGSTRGIGFGMAQEFLQAGCKVTINGKSQESVDHAMNLKVKEPALVHGYAVTVDEWENLENLWQNDAKIQWLTKPKATWRFISSIWRKRDIFSE